MVLSWFCPGLRSFGPEIAPLWRHVKQSILDDFQSPKVGENKPHSKHVARISATSAPHTGSERIQIILPYFWLVCQIS